MLKNSTIFSSFSVKDIDAAEKFYAEILELDVQRQPKGLALKLTGAHILFIYAKVDHEPASYTVLNFVVDDLEKTVDELTGKGIVFEQYDFEDLKTDERGIFRGSAGPKMIAWFTDPDGNLLSLLEQD